MNFFIIEELIVRFIYRLAPRGYMFNWNTGYTKVCMMCTLSNVEIKEGSVTMKEVQLAHNSHGSGSILLKDSKINKSVAIR